MKAYNLSYRRVKLPSIILVLICMCWSLTFQVQAEELITLADGQLSQWEYVTDSELEQMRGGFTLASGVEINFSIQKIGYINGVETNFFDFQLPNDVTIDGLRAGNLDLNGSGLGTVIQNNLDNQVFSTINTINLGISNLNNAALKNTSFDTRILNFR